MGKLTQTMANPKLTDFYVHVERKDEDGVPGWVLRIRSNEGYNEMHESRLTADEMFVLAGDIEQAAGMDVGSLSDLVVQAVREKTESVRALLARREREAEELPEIREKLAAMERLSGSVEGRPTAAEVSAMSGPWVCEVYDIAGEKLREVHVENLSTPCRLDVEMLDRAFSLVAYFGDVLGPEGSRNMGVRVPANFRRDGTHAIDFYSTGLARVVLVG